MRELLQRLSVVKTSEKEKILVENYDFSLSTVRRYGKIVLAVASGMLLISHLYEKRNSYLYEKKKCDMH